MQEEKKKTLARVERSIEIGVDALVRSTYRDPVIESYRQHGAESRERGRTDHVNEERLNRLD